jgi:dTDP-4-amino-4,6-dideoxygalactose transaminase
MEIPRRFGCPSQRFSGMPIHLFVPTFHVGECLSAVRACLEKGWTGLGYKTLEFEAAWKAYTGLLTPRE